MYQAQLEVQTAALTVIQARWNRLSNLRLVVAILVVAAARPPAARAERARAGRLLSGPRAGS